MKTLKVPFIADFEEIDLDDCTFLFMLLDAETKADVLVELEDDEREKLLETIPSDVIGEQLIDKMESDDAADILAAREAAFGNACACSTVQKPGNAAGIVTVLQRNAVVGDRTGDITDIRPSDNAAGAFLFCRHRTVVQALGHHNAISVLSACEKVGVCQVVLGIEFVLDRHAADDAADIRSISHPQLAGIDLNSRFETAPALKDVAKLQKFITDIRN